MDVVGGPVAGEGSAVVITVDAAHDLRLEGVAPNTGRVEWSHPYSMSAVDPGLAPALYVIDNVVVDLEPVDGPGGALVDVDGINATTGALAWHGPENLLVSDVPSPCAAARDFCLTRYESNASTSMVALDPVTGQTVGTLAGPLEAVDQDVYQTDAKTPTLVALSPSGSAAWTKTFEQLFGSSGYDPAYGWDFLAFGSTEVGTAGATDADRSDGLDDARTVGISLASGGTEWTLPGQFQCGGSLGFLSPAFDCLFAGTLARTHGRTSSQGVCRAPSQAAGHRRRHGSGLVDPTGGRRRRARQRRHRVLGRDPSGGAPELGGPGPVERGDRDHVGRRPSRAAVVRAPGALQGRREP